MLKVLLLTTDFSLRNTINLTLKYNGFQVQAAPSSESAFKLLKEINFDLIMVDYKLSHESGLGFYKALRQFGINLPLLMIGEGAFDEFMLKDLSNHNYDYLLRPFKFRELKLKIKTLLHQSTFSEDLLTYGAFKIDVKQQLVIVKDKIVQLGKTEMKILILLARKTGQVVHPKKIKELLENEGQLHSMSPMFYVNKLEAKMRQLVGESFEISLIQNQGFKLEFQP